ncbi:MAG: hypothetical protein KAX39_03555 [candidate division Zixibacteria bacterium]|nr:hypothetical protein [candidate division Zixibacteria bacterium]
MSKNHLKIDLRFTINSCLFFFRKIYYDLNKDNMGEKNTADDKRIYLMLQE